MAPDDVPGPPPSPGIATPAPTILPTPAATLAPAGSLDPAFGSGGIALVDFPRRAFNLSDVALDGSDRIVVLSESIVFERANERQFSLLRLGSDGSLDGTFGTDGFVETAVASALSPCTERPCDDSPLSVLVLEDDRLLVSGAVQSAALSPDDRQGVLLLYRPDGALDPDFGAGGIRTLSFANGPMFLTDLDDDATGRVVAAGSTAGDAFAESRFVVARFLADLSPDPAFGVRGIGSAAARHDLAPGFRDVAVRPDGSVVAGGGSGSFNFARPEVAAFTPDGVLDQGFGDLGFVAQFPPDLGLIAAVDRIVADDRGRVVIAIGDRLARYTTTGLPDETFGQDGVVRTGFAISELIAQPDDRLVVVGNSADGGVIGRYDDDGHLDPTFGTQGRTVLPAVAGRPARFFSAGVDSRGAIVVVGVLTGDPVIPLLIARYLTEPAQP